mmetsp:Transcript_12722/g.32060  ORF Transcript_12722/g.32060 Transcript_12722/m.32060 type:complete len:80 (-) Transcript_12722:585-824(-)
MHPTQPNELSGTTKNNIHKTKTENIQMIVVLDQDTAFPTIQGTRRSITPDLLIPKPATIAGFFIGNSLHQSWVLTAYAK